MIPVSGLEKDQAHFDKKLQEEGDKLRESVQEVVELGDSGRSVFTLTQVSSLGLLLQPPRWSEASSAAMLKSVLRLAELVLVSAILS